MAKRKINTLKTIPDHFNDTAKDVFLNVFPLVEDRVNFGNIHLLHAYCVSLATYFDLMQDMTGELVPGRDNEVKIDPRGREARSNLEQAMKLAQHFEITPYYASRSKYEPESKEKKQDPFKLRKVK